MRVGCSATTRSDRISTAPPGGGGCWRLPERSVEVCEQPTRAHAARDHRLSRNGRHQCTAKSFPTRARPAGRTQAVLIARSDTSLNCLATVSSRASRPSLSSSRFFRSPKYLSYK